MVKKWEPVSVLTKRKASSEVRSAYLQGKRLVVWLMWSWFFCSRWWTGWTNKTDSEKSLQGRSVRSTTHRYLLLLAIFVRSRLYVERCKATIGDKNLFALLHTRHSNTSFSPHPTYNVENYSLQFLPSFKILLCAFGKVEHSLRAFSNSSCKTQITGSFYFTIVPRTFVHHCRVQ